MKKAQASSAYSNLNSYSITIHAIALAALAMAVVALVVGWIGRRSVPSLCRESPRGWSMLGLPVTLPITHGLGTGNPIFVMIVDGFAGWMAIIIAVARPGTTVEVATQVSLLARNELVVDHLDAYGHRAPLRKLVVCAAHVRPPFALIAPTAVASGLRRRKRLRRAVLRNTVNTL